MEELQNIIMYFTDRRYNYHYFGHRYNQNAANGNEALHNTLSYGFYNIDTSRNEDKHSMIAHDT